MKTLSDYLVPVLLAMFIAFFLWVRGSHNYQVDDITAQLQQLEAFKAQGERNTAADGEYRDLQLEFLFEVQGLEYPGRPE